MAQPVDAVQTELNTDFAILLAVQEGLDGNPSASFAGSSPGAIGLEAGSKYSRVLIRAERWDERPPLTDQWEDIDDIPFEEVPTAGKLMLSGFDAGEVGLDVSRLGRGRVRVLARSRHRYHYGAAVDVSSMAPEEWLLQIYPLAGPIDPMAGGPRRIAGGGGLARYAGSGWRGAVHALYTSGWSDALVSSPGFRMAHLELSWRTAPVTRFELAKGMARRMPPWEPGGADAETLAVPPHRSFGHEADPLATLSGLTSIATIGDAIDALVSMGLLLVEERNGERLLIANPSPEPVWERLGHTGRNLIFARSRSLKQEHGIIAGDIACAVAWCREEGLTTTPRAMAIRWCTRVDDVEGGLRLLGGAGRVTSDRELGFDTEIDSDEPITLWAKGVQAPGTGSAQK